MAVSEQTPYQEFIANGTTTVFPLNFDAKEQDHLIVLLDDVEPQVGEWSFDFNTDQVTFLKAPKTNSVIKIRRDTPFKRDGSYQTYDGSFRPEPVNEDFDNIWRKLQEMGVLNWMIDNDIKDLGTYVDSLNDETKAIFLQMIEKQGVSMQQLDLYVQGLYKKLANVAVEKGWLAEFVAYGEITQKEFNQNQEELNEAQVLKNKQSINLDDFKTEGNTDTEALIDAIEYCKINKVPLLNITRDIEINQRIYTTQSDFKMDFHGKTVKWTGAGLNDLKYSAINFMGEISELSTQVSVSAAEFQASLSVFDSSIFNVGDDILIKSTSISLPMIYLNHCVRILAINGNVLTIDTIIRTPLSTTSPINVVKIKSIKNSGVVNLKFTAENQNSRDDGINGIYFEYSYGCYASVNCSNLYFKGIKINQSNNFTVLSGYYEKPVGVGGGEGYGCQFDYCVNSKAYNLTAYNMRHCLDITASWNIYVKDCFDYHSMSSSFNTHKAFEYDLTFENCHSIASYQHGFYFGSGIFSFGQTVDNIKMKNCSVQKSRSSCLAYTTLGKGLILEDCLLDPVSATSIYSAIVSNNNVEFIRLKTTSGISIVSEPTENVFTSGFLRFIDCSIKCNQNVARSLVIGVGASVDFSGGEIFGAINARSNTVLNLKNCYFESQLPSGWFDTAQDNTQKITLESVKLNASHAKVSSYNYLWKLKYLRLNNVEFAVPSTIENTHVFSNIDTVIKSCFGSVAMLLDGTVSTRYSIVGNNFDAISSKTIISSNSAYPLPCPVDINDNILKCKNSTDSAIIIGPPSVSISRLSLQRNSGIGRVRIENSSAEKCTIIGNNFEGEYILPVDDGVAKIVKFNI